MKQSKTQSHKVQVELPDFVTIAQYQEIMAIQKDASIFYKIMVISITIRKSFQYVKLLPMEVLPKLYNDCILMYSEKVEPVQAIRLGGKTLVTSMAFKKSIGEFSDLETMIQSKDIRKIAAVVFQELPVELDGWKAEQGYETIEVDGDFIDYSDLMLPYDCDNNMPLEFFEKFPMKVYNATMSFILGIGMTFSLVSRASSKQTPEMQQKIITNSKGITDGLVSCAILQKLTSFESQAI